MATWRIPTFAPSLARNESLQTDCDSLQIPCDNPWSWPSQPLARILKLSGPAISRSAASPRFATAAAKRRHVAIAQNPYSPTEKELIGQLKSRPPPVLT